MLLRIPNYYTQFQCIADKCSDSCCAGWEINIDEDTYEYYQQIRGEFGKRLRRNTSQDKERKFILQNRRCPFLNEKNLCDICIELGEEALCETCTEYPRSIMEYGNVREKCLSLSCEEAGRLIFESSEKCEFDEIEMPDEYEMACGDEMNDEMSCEYEMAADEMSCENVKMDEGMISDGLGECAAADECGIDQIHFYESVRNLAISIIQNRELSFLYRVEQLLRFSQEIQAVIDGETEQLLADILVEYEEQELLHKFLLKEKSVEDYHSKKPDIIKLQDGIKKRLQIYCQMESLDAEWGNTLKNVIELFGGEEIQVDTYITYHREFAEYYRNREYEYEHLMVYFLFRYGMMAIYDHKFLSKIKFSILSFLMIRDMDVNCYIRHGHQFTKKDRIDMARIYSKQVEHAQDILDYLEEELDKVTLEDELSVQVK